MKNQIKNPIHIQSRRGFTLLETLIATFILAGAIMALSGTWTGAKFSVKKAMSLNTISYLLQSKTTEYEIKYDGRTFDEMKEEDAGDFGAAFPEYRWVVKVQKFPAPDLRPLIADKDGAIDEMVGTMMKQFQEYLKKSVVEMKVSVFWKAAKKEMEYSITTILVNYDKELEPGAGL